MKSRTMLVGLAVVVVAGIVALILALRSGTDTRSTEGATDDRPSTATRARATTAGTRPRIQPAADALAGPRVDVDEAGTLVRDHRTRAAEPLGVHPVRRPKAIGKVETRTIMDVRTSLRPIVKRCAANIDDSALGDNPRAQTVSTVSIADGTLTVDRVDVQLAGVDDAGLADCIKKAALDVRIDAPDHPDVSGYPLTHPFRLRR